MEEIRYPLGKFEFQEPNAELRRKYIERYRSAPRLLRQAVDGLTTEQLLSRYRPDSWTLAQVVHHLAESDANAYIRLKYALTEEAPRVMVAAEAAWAELPDAKSPLIGGSLLMFEGLRLRWAEAWDSVREEDFKRTWDHSRYGLLTLDHLLQMLAWHASHHTAQIVEHRKRSGW